MEQKIEEANRVPKKTVFAFVVVILVIAALLLIVFPFSPFREIGPWNHQALEFFGEAALDGI
jgi:hypothetical protein